MFSHGSSPNFYQNIDFFYIFFTFIFIFGHINNHIAETYFWWFSVKMDTFHHIPAFRSCDRFWNMKNSTWMPKWLLVDKTSYISVNFWHTVKILVSIHMFSWPIYLFISSIVLHDSCIACKSNMAAKMAARNQIYAAYQ